MFLEPTVQLVARFQIAIVVEYILIVLWGQMFYLDRVIKSSFVELFPFIIA